MRKGRLADFISIREYEKMPRYKAIFASGKIGKIEGCVGWEKLRQLLKNKKVVILTDLGEEVMSPHGEEKEEKEK